MTIDRVISKDRPFIHGQWPDMIVLDDAPATWCVREVSLEVESPLQSPSHFREIQIEYMRMFGSLVI